jgi:predicted metalloprotease with PDZ domain
VRAEGDGRPLFWDKTDKDTWRIVAAGARRIAFEFQSNPDSLSLSLSSIQPDFAIINNTNLLVYPEGAALDFPSALAIEAPAGWKLATGLRQTAPGQYRAGNYHDLVDEPFFAGRLWMDSVMVDGKPVRFAIHPDSAMTPAIWDSLRHAITGIVTQQNRIFGGPPYEGYTVLWLAPFADMQWAGGLEHSNSQFDVIPAPYFADRASGQLGPFTRPLLSHEFFHLFNVKRVRPAEMWPYDYSREQFTPLLWWSEGVTDYYADVTLARSGLHTLDRFLESMQQNIAQVEDAAEIVAVEDASINTWIDPVYVNEGQYYYPKGSLIGLMLDIQIRTATRNQHNLDEIINRLYTAHWQRGRGFTTAELLGYIRPWWGGVDDFYTRYINGREPLPYAEILPLGGIAANVGEARVSFFGVALDTVPVQGGALVQRVAPNSPAARAGLIPGDIVMRIGDVVPGTNPGAFGVQYRARYRNTEGENIVVTFRRAGQEMQATTQTAQRVTRTVRIARDPAASGLPLEIRTGITGQR